METSKPQLWSKNFILMPLITFFIALTYFLTITSIAGYAMDGFDGT
ncbi:hypothetical protein [Bacillus sp. FJAT-44742]|nr:hypothetical protein [Bacillus sp. FJAT-44742]